MSAKEPSPGPSSTRLVSGVTGPVTSRVFRPADGASAHCQSDNLRLSAQVTFDWLEDELGASTMR